MELSRLPSTGKAEWSEFRLTRECAQLAGSPPVGKAFRLCRQLEAPDPKGSGAACAQRKSLFDSTGNVSYDTREKRHERSATHG